MLVYYFIKQAICFIKQASKQTYILKLMVLIVKPYFIKQAICFIKQAICFIKQASKLILLWF